MDLSKNFSGWPLKAADLIEQAVARHGGWEIWRRLKSIRLRLEHLGGPLPFVKGLNRSFFFPTEAEVFPHECRTVFQGLTAAGSSAVFNRGDVRITSPDVETAKEGKDHRESFRGLAKYRRWNDLDAVYFFGYALFNYLSLPFILKEMSFVTLRQARLHRESLNGLTVDFPENFPTHCRRQSFFFDSSGLLRRHDYVAEIIGGWARGSHFSEDYESVNGLQLATKRRVVATLFGRPSRIPVLQAKLGNFALHFPD